MRPLEGKVAVVAGATRGAGRGIACMLGEAGAIVYCTGRSVRGNPSPINRPETIEETAEMVTAQGGVGLWAQVDHTQPDQVEALFERVRREQEGHLDILVNDISGDWHIASEVLSGNAFQPFWKSSLRTGLLAQQDGVHSHIITSYYAAQLMVERKQGLIVEVNDGNHIAYNSCGLFYSLMKSSAVLLAYFMSCELQMHNIAAVSLTPGYLRSEKMLEGFGVTEENWRDAIKMDPDFAKSETLSTSVGRWLPWLPIRTSWRRQDVPSVQVTWRVNTALLMWMARSLLVTVRKACSGTVTSYIWKTNEQMKGSLVSRRATRSQAYVAGTHEWSR
jgi:NAD(P)-dependent dehydrogenase (short-subunit alcohol dehydrogenase family)